MNRTLFASTPRGKLIPPTTATNEAGGKAYALSDREALAQYAATGTFNGTFYASAEDQLERILELARRIYATEGGAEFIAKVAIYARRQGHMKDVPVFLAAFLVAMGSPFGPAAFRRVVTTGKNVRAFVQFLRSGVFGRKSLGSRPKRLVQEWLAAQSDANIIRASVGSVPSLKDVIKMAHPRPDNPTRQALYRWVLDQPLTNEHRAVLPEAIGHLAAFKAGAGSVPLDIPFELLTNSPLSTEQWRALARQGTWTWLRMNLNTLLRQGCFSDAKFVDEVAARLRDPQSVRMAKVMPYQLFSAYVNTPAELPAPIRGALQDALDLALENVPDLGRTLVMVDVSSSMTSAITGARKGSTSKVRCVDVASVFGAAFLRKAPDRTVLIPFADAPYRMNEKFNPRDSVVTNAERIAALCSGGTNCAAPLEYANLKKLEADVVVYLSDNQSWIESQNYGTQTMQQWRRFQQRNPNARLVCVDIQPYGTSQAPSSPEILNVGGFSDAVFDVIESFVQGRGSWTDRIQEVSLE